MKPKLLLCLALVLSGVLLGCSTAPNASTKVLDYSAGGDSPVADGVVIQGLGKSFSIRTTADSWPALVEKLKPTFVWNGYDLMWIETDKHGEPRFILDEAYIYQPTNQPRQWILVKDERTEENYNGWQNEDWWRQFGNYNLRAVANLQNSNRCQMTAIITEVIPWSKLRIGIMASFMKSAGRMKCPREMHIQYLADAFIFSKTRTIIGTFLAKDRVKAQSAAGKALLNPALNGRTPNKMKYHFKFDFIVKILNPQPAI